MKLLDYTIDLNKVKNNNIWSENSEIYSISVYSLIGIHLFDIFASEKDLVKLIGSIFDFLELDSKISRVLFNNLIIEIIKDNSDYNIDYIKIYKYNQYLNIYEKRLTITFSDYIPKYSLTSFAQELSSTFLKYKEEK